MTPDDVPGLISTAIGNRLIELASLVPADQIIIELGAYKGRSTCFLAEGSRRGNGAHVLSIDPWDTPGNTPGPKRKGPIYIASENKHLQRIHLEACGLANLVTSIQGYSHSVPLPAQPVGLLWIDGAHDYASVVEDIDRWSPLVVSGGFVVFDDYRAKCPGVDRAVDEMMQYATWPEWDMTIKSLAVGRRL